VREEGAGGGGAQPLIQAGADVAAHGGSFLTPWPLALGFPDAVGRGVRYWPHRPMLPTDGGSPAAVARGDRDPSVVRYGGRSLTLWATTSDVHLSKILFRPIIFRKS
jgi:hypothetical protein